MRYVPALDGLRAVAVLSVMVFHCSRNYLPGGFLGVDVFFVLSGFLITRILVEEQVLTGKINILRFYLRRALRLYPALLLMLAAYLATSFVTFPNMTLKSHARDVLLAGLYLSDYSSAFLAVPSMLGHSWSLAVEEHFYILWPLVLLLLLKSDRKLLPWLLLALVVVATFWRFQNVAVGIDWRPIYFRFDTRLSGLLMGALLAFLPFERLPAGKLRSLFGFMAFAVLLVAVMVFEWRNEQSLKYGMLIAELATVFLIMAAMGEGAFSQLLSVKPMVWIGKLSYGLYLWHYPVMRYLDQHFTPVYVLLLGGLISFGCAYVSFHTIEVWSRNKRHPKPQSEMKVGSVIEVRG